MSGCLERPDARRRLPWIGIMVPLVLGFAFSLGLAYQTWDAAREHRAAAEATVRDHANFAAHLLAERVDRRMSQAMLYAFYRVDLAIRDGERWPDVEELAAEQELRRCEGTNARSGRVFFRLVDGMLDVAGDADPELRGWLETWVGDATAADPGERPFGLRFGAPGIGTDGIAYRVFRDREGNALYGLDNCFRDLSANVFEGAVAEAGVLPPSLVGDTPNDSLFTLTAIGGTGREVYGGPSDDYAGFVGRAALEPTDAYGGLSLALRLREATAQRLVIGGLPRSRLPEALGFVALTALLLGLAARQLRRGQELLSMRERLIANVSHELRTPLQQILLFTDLLRLKRVSTEEEEGQAVGVIHRETRRLINLVESVLAFSTPHADPAEASRGETALLELVTTVAESFRPIAEERGVRLLLDGEEVVVRGGSEALQQILLNLLDNAVKHGPRGQTVRLSVSRRDGLGVVSVQDEGPGIPTADRDRIWDAYVRLDPKDGESRAGQGVGLAIVRDLVERMDGRVRVRDMAIGARFEVEIPVGE